MRLITRALELAGISTTLTSWNRDSIFRSLPPRATITSLEKGMTSGHPYEKDQQKRVLLTTLELLSVDAPIDSVIIDEV